MELSTRAISELSEQPLPLQPSSLRTWAGYGSGTVCNGCGSTIKQQEVEYEIEMPAGSVTPALHFHLACYRKWSGYEAS